jgi:hypothetical protein
MQLLAPDILEEARGLSVALLGIACVLGLAIWLLGWRGHRFWIVLATTIGAGLYGLCSAPSNGLHAIAAGLLLALAAGILALALVRVLAFAAAGFAACVVVRGLAPTWNEPLVSFLVGGLVGLFLFRLWTMALTSLAGTLLMAYSGLCLANKLGNLDAVALAAGHTALLNGACGSVAILGLAVQFLLERQHARQSKRQSSGSKSSSSSSQSSSAWWGGRTYRRAG